MTDLIMLPLAADPSRIRNAVDAACAGSPSQRSEASAVEAAAAAWLQTQSRVIEHWIDAAIAEGADVRLIAALDHHAAFLSEAMVMISGAVPSCVSPAQSRY